MNPVLHVAAAQLAPTNDAEANRGEIALLVAEAAQHGAKLVVFPEEAMLLASEAAGDLAETVAAEWPSFLEHLSLLAREYGVWIIAGGYEPSGSPRPYNSIVVVNPQGQCVENYRKLHLYDAFSYKESDYVTGGLELPPVVLIEGVAVGLINCYDLRFPEMGRSLIDRGADLLSVSAAWVTGARKEQHWATLLQARAIENTCWVVGASSASPDCIGNSMIVDPLGVARAQLGPETPALIHLQVSLDRTADVRDKLPSLANRRLETAISVRKELI